jgi:hypothetical protein
MNRAFAACLVAVSLVVAVGCGDDDDESSDQPETTASSSSPAQTCVDSWNAEANGGHQTSLAGIISAVGLAPDEWRVGTWPGPEQTVPVWSPEIAFADSTDKDTVPTDSCLISAPESHEGDVSFFEAEGGKWQLVKSNSTPRSKFPAEARKRIADAETATADALGKLTLN